MNGFWRDRRVLVTGHTGFKGGWLVLSLRRLGARVSGIALPPEATPCLFDEASIDDTCDSRIVDLRDAEATAGALRAIRPEVVFHLAAQPLVRASYDRAAATWAVNVMGTIHLLDACRAIDGVRAVVVATTDKCYEQGGSAAAARSRPFREDDRLGGHDPYSSSKSAVEIAVASWRRSFLAATGTGVATARAGNVIGAGDWSVDRLVPDLVRSARTHEPVALRSPDATRPWQHVLDPLAGYLRLAEALHRDPDAHGEAWNFGPDADASWPVARVARTFADALDRGACWRVCGPPSLHEATDLALDSTKARRRLGWRPAHGLERAIAMTADGYRAHLDGGSLAHVVERQVDAHFAAHAPVREVA